MFKVSKLPCTPYTAIRSCVKSFLQRNERCFIIQCEKKFYLFFITLFVLYLKSVFLSELQIKRLSLKENVRTIFKLVISKRSNDGCTCIHITKKKPCKLILITLEEFQRVKASANDASRSLKYRYIDY